MTHTDHDPPAYNNASGTALLVDRTSGGPYTIELGWMGDFPGGYYTGWHPNLVFDTSALPDDAIITSANLSFVTDTIPPGRYPEAYLAWDSYYTYPHDPPLLTDWPRYLYTVDGGSYNTTPIIYNDFRVNVTLSNVAQHHINLTGKTTFVLMDQHDLYEDDAPTVYWNPTWYDIRNASSWFDNRNPILHVEYGVGGPPPGNPCNVTAVIQNTANGNALSGSTINIYDVSTGTHEHFYLPFGSGSVSIPYMHDLYKWNATKPGYTGYPAYPEGGVAVPTVGFETCADITLYTQLTGPPMAETNCTLSFTVEGTPCSGYMCIIPNAQVSLSDGQATITNYAGFASFITAKNTTYNYSVSKTGYQGLDGSIDIGNDDAINIPIKLISGTVPTATTTTYAPGVPHDTTNEALDFLKQNTLNLVMLFFVVTIIGAIKLMSK